MKPTERFKKRYISFMLSCEDKPLPFAEAKDCVHLHFLSYFGEAGASALAFKLMRYSDRDGKGIVRCERSRLEEAIFCMACFSEWKGKPARMEPISTSGTVRRV